MVESDDESARDNPLMKAVEQIKAHPLVFGALTTVAVVGFVFETTDLFTRASGVVSGILDPHAEEYAALETLDLDTRLEYFEDHFGVAKSVFDLCSESRLCPESESDSFRMYIHETDDLAIRAVFDGESLEMYAVTLRSSILSPEMEWLGWELGNLGDVTFAEAVGAIDTIEEPTDVAIFMGPQAIAYSEVVASGAPGHYRGLLLAIAPDGYFSQDMSFNSDAGRKIDQAQIRHKGPDPAVLADFRSSTTPNTYGEFRDDGGYIGDRLHEASELIPLLFVGTEL